MAICLNPSQHEGLIAHCNPLPMAVSNRLTLFQSSVGLIAHCNGLKNPYVQDCIYCQYRANLGAKATSAV